MTDWPTWWWWPLELTPHVLKRMEDRGFTELDLREMLEKATTMRPDVVQERYIIQTRHEGAAWEVIVEPDAVDQLLVVITAYRVTR